MIDNQYSPDAVSPPGDTLAETLALLEISPADLAATMGCPPAAVDGIIHGSTAITPALTSELERALGVPAHVWLKRQQD